MKKFILTAIAASIVASPFVATAASATPWQADRYHQANRESRVVRHQPGRTVIITRNVRYDRAPAWRHDWRRDARADYRHPHHYRVSYDHRDYR